MTKHTFKVRKDKSSEPVEYTVKMPSTIDDESLIIDRFGSVERMIERACSQWTVDVATGIRKRLPDTAAAKKYADTYCDNGTRDTFAPKKLDAAEAKKAAGFTDAQLEFLRKAGMIA